jgi:membrane protease YdiL (CAAX protease family)
VIPIPPPPDASGGIADRIEEGRRGPGGLLAVTWGAIEALGLFILGDLAIGQVLVAGLVLAAMGVQQQQITQGLPSIVATVSADLAFLVVMVGWSRWRAPDARARIGVRFGRVGAIDAAKGFGAGLVLYGVVALVIGAPLLWVFRQIFGQQVQQPQQIATDISAGAKALAVFTAVIVAPVTEELFFRGILYRGIRDRHGVALGVIGSAVVFGAVHAPADAWRNVLFLQTLMCFTGAGLALIYERRANLVASVAAHMAFNVIGVIAIFHGY